MRRLKAQIQSSGSLSASERVYLPEYVDLIHPSGDATCALRIDGEQPVLWLNLAMPWGMRRRSHAGGVPGRIARRLGMLDHGRFATQRPVAGDRWYRLERESLCRSRSNWFCITGIVTRLPQPTRRRLKPRNTRNTRKGKQRKRSDLNPPRFAYFVYFAVPPPVPF